MLRTLFPAKMLKIFSFLIVVVSPLICVSCQSSSLPFEGIESDDYSQYLEQEPNIILINNDRGIDQLETLISSSSLERLREIDFGEYFCIVLFQGRRSTSGYGVEIESIKGRDGDIVVKARFYEPGAKFVVSYEETSPYHLVKAERGVAIDEGTELILEHHTIVRKP